MYAYQNAHNASYNQLMAASVLFVLPIAALFLIGQRSLLSGGIAGTGLKG